MVNLLNLTNNRRVFQKYGFDLKKKGPDLISRRQRGQTVNRWPNGKLAAKIILDMPKHSSASEALDQFGWDNLMKRRTFHRLILFFKDLNGYILTGILTFIVLEIFIITTIEVEVTFVGPGPKPISVLKIILLASSQNVNFAKICKNWFMRFARLLRLEKKEPASQRSLQISQLGYLCKLSA